MIFMKLKTLYFHYLIPVSQKPSKKPSKIFEGIIIDSNDLLILKSSIQEFWKYRLNCVGFVSQRKKHKSTSQKYEVAKSPGVIGVFANPDRGATSIKALDVDKDGDLDLAIATEGTNYNGIEMWSNDGQGNYTPSNQKLGFDASQMSFREFEVIDIDSDGWEDIILNPYHYGKLFRIGSDGYSNGSGIILNNLIWKNSSGTFALLSKDIFFPNIVPTYLKAFKINDKFYFLGIEGKPDGSMIITEIIPCLQ